tara:strand:- start:176 stop:517 length:342 start_codon:yes stop_codon:yes gene_type:complete
MKNVGNDGRTHREVVEDVCGCEGGNYCILRELIIAGGPDDRTLDQMKCLEIFKFEREIKGSKNDEDGWEKASKLWVAEGYAAKFSEVYDQHHNYLKVKGMYNMIMDRHPLEND